MMHALCGVPDPEMPLSIVDLGMVGAVRVSNISGGASVQIDLIPTFVGCPALAVIEQDVRKAVGALPSVAELRVSFVYEPPWSVERITDAGRAALHRAGITVPKRGCASRPVFVPLGISISLESVACPLCGSTSTHLDTPFGPTRCKMIYYCDACRNAFEHMKNV
ncbi:MAG: phenylacetate-CoA oxygenase subunit PaaJ [Phycisphaerales bacterium]|nr:phenylacetate-CoA oxygenase subunit PaaJ [Phycisphaerales bacterium]